MSTIERPKLHPDHPLLIDVVEDGTPIPQIYDQDQDVTVSASGGQTVPQEIASQRHIEEEFRSEGRFSGVFARVRARLAVNDGRWDAKPIAPHAQAFDISDTWQDPFEKFYGPSGPVIEYTAVPPRLYANEKTKTVSGTESEADNTEKQTHRKAMVARLTGAWASSSVKELIDEVDERQAAYGEVKKILKVAALKELEKQQNESTENTDRQPDNHDMRHVSNLGFLRQAAEDLSRHERNKNYLQRSFVAAGAGVLVLAALKLRK